MQQYIELVKYILDKGIKKKNRTKINSISVFGYQMRFDLNNGFPLLTTKQIHIKSIIYELLWFLSGNTNIKYLNKNKISIWDNWSDTKGDLGPIYGFQWRKWDKNNPIDQINNLINNINKDPYSRRHIVSSWNVSMIDKMALPPCHTLFQIYINNNEISMQLYQRSADVFLGLPFNIASYSLLLIMIAQVTKLKVKEFIHTLGDAHIYENHIPQCLIQIQRKYKKLPTIVLNQKITNIFDFKFRDIYLYNYQPHPSIKAEVAI
jgi:thymidylate synthase